MDDTKDNEQTTINWMGATIKSITTMAERSAAGLSETAGVIVLSIEEQSIISLSDLKEGDVIIAETIKK